MKTETKIYQAPVCQIIQVDLTAPILVGSGSSTTEGITIDGDEFEW